MGFGADRLSDLRNMETENAADNVAFDITDIDEVVAMLSQLAQSKSIRDELSMMANMAPATCHFVTTMQVWPSLPVRGSCSRRRRTCESPE